MGVILAGGESSRMGINKASLYIDGNSFLHKAVETLRQLGIDTITVVGQRHVLGPPLPYVTYLDDVYEGLGPLSGIQSALNFGTKRNAKQEACMEGAIIVPVDMPNLTVNVLSCLVEKGQRGNRPSCYKFRGKTLHFPLYLPLDKELISRTERLLVNAANTPVGHQKKRRELSIRNILLDNNAQTIETHDRHSFININTPEELTNFRSQKLTTGK